MSKRIAVLTRNRQGEALRMALGLTLMNDTIDVYVLNKKVEDNEENTLNLETMKEMDMSLYTNCKENKDMQYISTEEIGQRLPEYDLVLPY